MLPIIIPATELWDEGTQRFIYVEAQTLQLEHSLVALSKWESKWNKAFLSKKRKTNKEVLDYIKCMTLTPNVQPEVYRCFSTADYEAIDKYINQPMTATFIADFSSGKKSNEVVTTELIYYWMMMLNIPFECETWHLNRLISLIKLTSAKNTPGKKMSEKELATYYADLNAKRRKEWNTKG